MARSPTLLTSRYDRSNSARGKRFHLGLIAVLLFTGAGCPLFPDTDGDGTIDSADQCPEDPAKIAPGQCGCGNADVDANNNGTADCLDPPDPPVGNASIAGQLSVQTNADTSFATFVPGELLVAFDNHLTPADQQDLLARCNLCCVEQSPSGIARISCPINRAANTKEQCTETLRILAALRLEPGVRWAETNPYRYIARTPNDEFFQHQWHYSAINMVEAWNTTIGSDQVIVAVIDTGILSQHPDLQGRITPGFDFIADPASARDGDGRDPNPEDVGDLFGGPDQSSFHGTHIAGIIAATTDNGVGVAGVTWRTRVMPVRALGVNGGTAFDVAEAIRFAAGLPNVSGTVPAQAAKIINLSVAGLAGAPPSGFEIAAITDVTNAGLLVVGAAGNENSSLPNYPAAAPEVISVGGLDIQMNRARYSNFGPTVDLMAPGGFNGTDINGDNFADGVLSTGGSDVGTDITFEYIFSNGTSMACPQVAGVAALVFAANPALNAGEVREVLETTARDLGAAGRDDEFGFGIIDAAAALREALRRAGQAPTNSPVLSLSVNSLDFRDDLNELRVHIGNSGGGFLNVLSVAASVQQGNGWLNATLSGKPANANVDTITIAVNRAGQPAGTLTGTVTVIAQNLPPAAIQVSVKVGPSETNNETIYVLAVLPPPNLTSIGEDQTNAVRGFVYKIADLPAGSYVIYAGTDRDNDGIVCEEGDLCGALTSLSQPQILVVVAGQELQHLDFSVAQRVLEQVTHENAGQFPSLQRSR